MSKNVANSSASVMLLLLAVVAHAQQGEFSPRFSLVDLTPHFNSNSDEPLHDPANAGNVLTHLPKGRLLFCGVPFQVTNQVMQLGSSDRLMRERPKEIGPIPVGSRCACLHFLHAFGRGEDVVDGTPVGEYLVRYTDGQEAIQPLVCGTNIRNWWHPLPMDEAALAWRGRNQSQKANKQWPMVGLYVSSWGNPRPEEVVESVVMRTAQTFSSAAPFCLAITVDRSSPGLNYAEVSLPNARVLQQEWAAKLDVPVEITNSVGMALVLIPPGEFAMGSPAGELQRCPDEQQHWVRMNLARPFRLSAHEVTQGQYAQVMGLEPAGDNGAGRDASQRAQVNISWEGAIEFCRRLSEKEQAAGRVYRLPTEAEWEYACRAFTTTLFHFGDQSTGPEARCWGASWDGAKTNGLGPERTTAVGSYEANAFGLYDMHGNVWEWCHDWYDRHYYRDSPLQDPRGPAAGTFRVVRGGSWDYGPDFARSAARWRTPPTDRLDNTGFRVAVDPAVVSQPGRSDEPLGPAAASQADSPAAP